MAYPKANPVGIMPYSPSGSGLAGPEAKVTKEKITG